MAINIKQIIKEELVHHKLDEHFKRTHANDVEKLHEAKWNFSHSAVIRASEILAKAMANVEKVAIEVHDLEWDKGRGAGFDLSWDGDKGDGGSYGVSANGDIVNHAYPGKPVYGNIRSNQRDFEKGIRKYSKKRNESINEGKSFYQDVIDMNKSFRLLKIQSPDSYKEIDKKFKVRDIQKLLSNMRDFMDTAMLSPIPEMREGKVNEAMSFHKILQKLVKNMSSNAYANFADEHLNDPNDANEMQEFIEDTTKAEAIHFAKEIKKGLYESKVNEAVKPIKLSGNLKKDLKTVVAMAGKMVKYAKVNFNTYIPTGHMLSQLINGGSTEEDVLKYNINHLAKAINTDLKKKYMKDFMGESVTEGSRKKVTKSMWQKMSDDEKENALLTVFEDPDTAQKWIERKWNSLPGSVARDMYTESINEAKVWTLISGGKGFIKDVSGKTTMKLKDALKFKNIKAATKASSEIAKTGIPNMVHVMNETINEASSLFKKFDDLMNLRMKSMDVEQTIMDREKELKQLYMDMEQEAEPEGGPKASAYGKRIESLTKILNKDKAILSYILKKIDKLDQY